MESVYGICVVEDLVVHRLAAKCNGQGNSSMALKENISGVYTVQGCTIGWFI